jgi:glutamate-1-semialdehyde 2,1-aminomutase
MNHSRSAELYADACSLMPGGVNSPVRAFRAVGGTPLYIAKAHGPRVTDIDGNEFIDYVSSWGAIILGHANPIVNEAIARAAAQGTSFGAPHEGEIHLARQVVERMPGLEWVRFVNSGTEAALGAIRLARAATGRAKILKFAGNYHGAVDALLAKAGSGVATFGLPDSAGVPADVTHGTLVARYNDIAHVRELLNANPDVAAVMVEPVAGNMGLVLPKLGFLRELAEAARQAGALLVFDEVMTGFRVARGGAAERFGITPDISIMGKVIGGGLPVGAYGGRRDLMELVAPLGPMYQAGTLSGNPLAMAAGMAALNTLTPDLYAHLESHGARLETGLREATVSAGVPAQIYRMGSMISMFFTAEPVTDFESAQTTDRAFYGRLFHELLRRGIYLPPSALESWFFTATHTISIIDQTVDVFADALREARA